MMVVRSKGPVLIYEGASKKPQAGSLLMDVERASSHYLTSKSFAWNLACAVLQALGASVEQVRTATEGQAQHALPLGSQGSVARLTEFDERVAASLERDGMLVYYVLPSFWTMDGRLIAELCYLCVPLNIALAVLGTNRRAIPLSERFDRVAVWVTNKLELARRGSVAAFVINPETGQGVYCTIEVRREGETLVRS